MHQITDQKQYLERMSKSLQEKLKIGRYIPDGTESVLDVGCADGTVTLALADLYPEVYFVGIDMNENFIKIADDRVGSRKNIKFEKRFLRERLADNERFDVVLFCSILHEFYSYGEGISTVVKALSDAHEIMKNDGTMIIRDMILYDYAGNSRLWLDEMLGKVKARAELNAQLTEFEKYFGKIASIKQFNHFLLKYMYADNWEREGRENYVPVSFEEYDQIFKLLGMTVLFQRSSTISYLKEKWKNDFDFTDYELESLRSTGIIVTKK